MWHVFSNCHEVLVYIMIRGSIALALHLLVLASLTIFRNWGNLAQYFDFSRPAAGLYFNFSLVALHSIVFTGSAIALASVIHHNDESDDPGSDTWDDDDRDAWTRAAKYMEIVLMVSALGMFLWMIPMLVSSLWILRLPRRNITVDQMRAELYQNHRSHSVVIWAVFSLVLFSLILAHTWKQVDSLGFKSTLVYVNFLIFVVLAILFALTAAVIVVMFMSSNFPPRVVFVLQVSTPSVIHRCPAIRLAIPHTMTTFFLLPCCMLYVLRRPSEL